MILKTTKVNKLEWVSTYTPNLSYISPKWLKYGKVVYDITINKKGA